MMTFFLCLPCFGKREVKRAFNIPVASLENTVKANELSTCQAFTKKKTQKFSAAYWKNDRPSYPQNKLHFQQIFNTSCNKNEALTSVPIYILHEQYLI